ncbi:MAG: hypothetical protein GKS06_17385 [Acidobacteria bacterium]|nr:hypothetical protein [Acidobacteriota bacterium]
MGMSRNSERSDWLPDAVDRRLICYARPICPLCDEVKPVLRRLAAEFSLDLEIRNVEDDPEWERRYGGQIPVAFVGRTKLFKYRSTELELRGRIELALAE